MSEPDRLRAQPTVEERGMETLDMSRPQGLETQRPEVRVYVESRMGAITLERRWFCVIGSVGLEPAV